MPHHWHRLKKKSKKWVHHVIWHLLINQPCYFWTTRDFFFFLFSSIYINVWLRDCCRSIHIIILSVSRQWFELDYAPQLNMHSIWWTFYLSPWFDKFRYHNLTNSCFHLKIWCLRRILWNPFEGSSEGLKQLQREGAKKKWSFLFKSKVKRDTENSECLKD